MDGCVAVAVAVAVAEADQSIHDQSIHDQSILDESNPKEKTTTTRRLRGFKGPPYKNNNDNKCESVTPVERQVPGMISALHAFPGPKVSVPRSQSQGPCPKVPVPWDPLVPWVPWDPWDPWDLWVSWVPWVPWVP